MEGKHRHRFGPTRMTGGDPKKARTYRKCVTKGCEKRVYMTIKKYVEREERSSAPVAPKRIGQWHLVP